MELKDIFAKVYDYLASNDLIVGQEDLAIKMGTTPTTISRVKHGMVKKISEKNIKKLNSSFRNVFNPDFLRGKSDIMLMDDVKEQTLHNFTSDQQIDPSSLVNAAIAGYETAITELRDKILYKDEVIAEKKAHLKEKDDRIAELKQQVADLRAQISILQAKEIAGNYSIPVGVADERTRPSARK